MTLNEMYKELETAGTLKYIKLSRKNQLLYYDYKNLSVVLRYNIVTDTVEYISFTRKETKRQ